MVIDRREGKTSYSVHVDGWVDEEGGLLAGYIGCASTAGSAKGARGVCDRA